MIHFTFDRPHPKKSMPRLMSMQENAGFFPFRQTGIIAKSPTSK
jgi:hypothetical protein